VAQQGRMADKQSLDKNFVSVPPITSQGMGMEFSTLCIGHEATLV